MSEDINIINNDNQFTSKTKNNSKKESKLKEKVECENCNRIFANVYTLQRHYKSCKKILQENEKDKTIEQQKESITNLIFEVKLILSKYELLKEQHDKLQEQYDKLQEQYTLVCSQAKIINNYNTSTNNNLTVKQFVSTLQPITSEDFSNSLHFYTEKYIDEGAIGYAKFILDHPCNNKIITTDLSRKVVAYRTDKNEFIKDPKCRELIKLAIEDQKDEILSLCVERRKKLSHDQYNDSDLIMYEIYSKKISDISEFIIFLKNDLEDCDETNVPTKISYQITASTPQYNNVKNIQEIE